MIAVLEHSGSIQASGLCSALCRRWLTLWRCVTHTLWWLPAAMILLRLCATRFLRQRPRSRTMISQILISASAGMILFFGSVHLAYTFLTHKFSPTEKQLETAMKQVAPRISREATMWKVWIGIHVSHSMGLVMFGLIYGYLELSRWDDMLEMCHQTLGLYSSTVP